MTRCEKCAKEDKNAIYNVVRTAGDMDAAWRRLVSEYPQTHLPLYVTNAAAELSKFYGIYFFGGAKVRV